MEDMLWIKDIVKSTSTPPFWQILELMWLLSWIFTNATSTFPSAWNGGESKDGVESEKLKRQFSQVERRFGFTKNP
jgi:hypothetical protein